MKDSLTWLLPIAINSVTTMAFVGVKISSAKLRPLLLAEFKSVARAARVLGISSGTLFNWLKQKAPGIDPDIHANLLKHLGVEASEIEPDRDGSEGMAEVAAMAARRGLKHDQVIAHFQKLKVAASRERGAKLK